MQDRKDRQGKGEERELEREVLALVLVEQPLQLTLREMQSALGRPLEVERAVAGLVGSGLLSLEGDRVVPTAAAIRFNQLEPIEPPHS